MSGPTTLPDLLARGAARWGERIAMVEGADRLTYAELHDQAQRMAALMHRMGVRQGDRVALLMPPSIPHALAFFGCAMLGAVAVALHVRESVPTLQRLAEAVMPQLVIHDDAYADLARAVLEALPAGTARLRARCSASPDSRDTAPALPDALTDQAPLNEPIPVRPQDLAAIVLSSGTTGLPKGVMHSHASLTGGLEQGADYMGRATGAATINVFTTAFIGWMNCTLPQLHVGAKIVYLPRFDPAAYLATIAAERISFFILVPTMWRMLLAAGPEHHDLSSLWRVGFAGEPIDLPTLEAIRARICPRVMNTYGTTETGPWGGCSVMLPEDYAAGADLRSIGRPAHGVEMRVIAPGGRLDAVLPPGKEGELIVHGPSLAQRLWQREAQSARVFEGGWWRSGDLARMDAQGYITLSGRVDDMMISGGINVMPGQVEEVIRRHPGVRDCAVAGVPSAEWGQQITGFVVGEGLDAASLSAFLLSTELSHYKHPRAWVFLDALPRGNTGKVNRAALRARCAEGTP